jgi:hypothetical protein
MLAQARRRIEDHGWGNTVLLQATAEEATIPARADAALFCASHDILRSRPALTNVFASLRPGSRVVAVGGKWTAPWMLPLNLLVFYGHLRYVNSFEGFERPWNHLERFLDEYEVTPLALGSAYLLSGSTPA